MKPIITLPIKYTYGDTENIIHPVILLDNHEMILVDCGFTGYLPQIERAMEQQGLSCNQLTKVLITHDDYDHTGSLSALKRKYPAVQIIASHIEAPYISGSRKSLRLEQAEKLQSTLPEDQQASGLAYCEMLRQVEPAPIDILVKEGDILDWCGGCRILETPGHTPGHISLYLEKYSTIITGDAAVLDNNELVIANPEFTLSMEDAKASLERLLHYGAEVYICYHGGIYRK